MAKCDEGYLCEVCGTEVEGITDSDRYLRYVIGEVDPEQLHTLKERHLRCNPILAQFIVDERFQLGAEVPTVVEGFTNPSGLYQLSLVGGRYDITVVPNVAGGMNGVQIDPDTGLITGAACWRADGSPAGLAGGAADIEARFNPLV